MAFDITTNYTSGETLVGIVMNGNTQVGVDYSLTESTNESGFYYNQGIDTSTYGTGIYSVLIKDFTTGEILGGTSQEFVNNVTREDFDKTQGDAIEADTNELQTNQGNFATATGFATPTDVTNSQTAVISEIDANETKIDTVISNLGNIPTNPLLTNDPRLDNLDATISSRSTLTAQNVWEYVSRSLTGFGTLVSDIWSNASRTITGGDIDVVNDKTGYALSATDKDDIVDRVWDEPLTGSTHNNATSSGRRLRQAAQWLAVEGSAIGTPTVSTVQTDITQTNTSFYRDQQFVFTSGVLQGQSRIVASYDGTTKTFTFDEDWTLTPSAGDEFAVFADHTHTITQIQDGLAKTTELNTAEANLTTEINANETKIDQAITDIGNLNDISEAQVNAQVDIALSDYDAPTKAELDTLESNVTTEINANETKIDTLTTNVSNLPQNNDLSVTDKEDIAVRVESHLLDEGDGQMLINAIVTAIGNTNVDEIALVAAIRADLERTGGLLDNTATFTELTSAFTEVKGAGWTTETLKDIRDNLGTGGTTPADVYNYFVDSNREDPFKADVSNIATLTELTNAFTEIKGSGWTTANTLKAISDLINALNNFDPSTDNVIVGTNNDKTGYSVDTNNDKTGYQIDGTKTRLDELNDFNKNTETVNVNETTHHTSLDNYANKDDWKADAISGTIDANIVSVTGTAVTDINDFTGVITLFTNDQLDADLSYTIPLADSTSEIELLFEQTSSFQIGITDHLTKVNKTIGEIQAVEFYIKENAEDTDTEANLMKSLGSGITVNTTNVSLDVLIQDTDYTNLNIHDKYFVFMAVQYTDSTFYEILQDKRLRVKQDGIRKTSL